MLSEFTKVFGRNFILAHFIPSVLYVGATALLVSQFFSYEADNVMSVMNALAAFFTLAVWIFVAWTLGCLLLTVNRVIIRLLEGYYILNKTYLRSRYIERFNRLIEEINFTSQKYKKEEQEKGSVSTETKAQYMKLMLKRRRDFPLSNEDIMATSFGNIMRTAENYPYETYGIDAVAVWSRFVGVMPSEFADYIDNARASIDFAANLLFLSLMFSLQYIIFALITDSWPVYWAPVFAVLLAIFSYRLSITTGRQWGERIKAVFDLYRSDLLQKLGFEIPLTWEEERNCWREVNQTFLYWDPPDDLSWPKAKPKDQEPTSTEEI